MPDDDAARNAPADSKPAAPNLNGTATFFEGIRSDFATIRLILLTAVVVLVIISVPLIYWIPKLVTFDALDKILKVTDNVQPRILTNISEELGSAYSKSFAIVSPTSDSSLVFYSEPKQRVFLSLEVSPYQGGAVQPVKLQINGCSLPDGPNEPGYVSIDRKEITKHVERCRPHGNLDESQTNTLNNINTLRIIFPKGLDKGNTLEVKLLVLVLQRVHQHVGSSNSNTDTQDGPR